LEENCKGEGKKSPKKEKNWNGTGSGEVKKPYKEEKKERAAN